jgi:hypothetical protein
MQIEQMHSMARSLGFVVMLAMGLVLGTAVPTSAQTEDSSTIAACNTEEVTSTGESEWAVPPMQTQPGEPY